MGIYSEYLGQPLAGSFEQLAAERKHQLRRISGIRGGRDVLVFAAYLNKENPLISISYVDILPISDQLANLDGTALDLILETPGGSGEIAEDIVRLLRKKYNDIAVIIPGWAKSAGTIIAMAADEILMGSTSALGPIDAQLSWQGKRFSADALLEGMNKIKDEVAETGILNKAYIPILQGMPGIHLTQVTPTSCSWAHSVLASRRGGDDRAVRRRLHRHGLLHKAVEELAPTA